MSTRSAGQNKKKIVVLGMMSTQPVPGIIWMTMHYLIGLRRLGHDVYYVEAHALWPSRFMAHDDDGSAGAAAFIDGIMRRFDLGDRWAYQAHHADSHCYGLSEAQVGALYRSADVLINLHGGTVPRPEHYATGRLVYLETDPVAPQIELHDKVQWTIDYMARHTAFFTFAENYGAPDCELPVTALFAYRPTRQPVVLDLWQPFSREGSAFTTIASWRQAGKEITYRGEVYHWSKHLEFQKFLDLPKRTGACFELALNRHEEDACLLRSKGWALRDALAFGDDIDAYRRYIAGSRGEFTVAKDQNVRLRSGWFSDRSATYLAAGKPVITQETGFSNILPTGEGLFGFLTLEEAEDAIARVNADYARHSRRAVDLAREHFSHEVVLTRLLREIGV
jgi:hypothetical protein